MKYRKRPVVIEAMQLTETNSLEVYNWINTDQASKCGSVVKIETLEGTMTANVGDWIIRGVKGEYYPCKPDIFEATYEKVEETK